MTKLIGQCCLAVLLVTTTLFSEISASTPVNGTFTTSNMNFDMDACSSFPAQNTNTDYSEFIPVINNSDACLQMSILNNSLRREEPLRNPHSCTPGILGSAMCVSSVADCTFPAGHMRSVLIDVQVVPGSDGSGTLSSLSFYEQAPIEYNWIDGETGLNNFPTLYGVRVLKDGVEVFRSADNATTNDWTRESFSFLDNPEFTVTETSVFTFEFIGYCLVGNGSLVNAWDLDEISIESSCGTIIDGGSLSLPNGAVSTSVCVGTGAGAPVNVDLVGNSSTNGSFFITDDMGNIITVPTGGPPFDFEGAGPGICQIWFVAYEGTLNGLTAGANMADFDGCFDLSNPVSVNRMSASPATISTTSGTTICANNSSPIDVSITGGNGMNRWVITNDLGNIIGLPSAPPFDLSQFSNAQCIIQNVSFVGNLAGFAIGSNINSLSGDCFTLSNPIVITKESVEGGVLGSNGFSFINICEGNGTSNIVDLVVNNVRGDNNQIVLADENGVIIDANPMIPFDFSGFDSGAFRFYNVSWSGTLNGLTVGSNINNLSGTCFDISNSVIIDKELAEGGTITSPLGDSFEVCIEGVVSEPIDVSLSGNQGEFGRWIFTDANGTVIALPNDPPFLLDPTVGPVCIVRFLSFEDSFRGLFLGQNISEFEGCFDLSNSITITKNRASGGTITDNGFTFIDICANSSSQLISVDLVRNIGDNSIFLISDLNGNIVATSNDPNIDFSTFGDGNYNITHLAYANGVSGAVVGGNINNITGDCLDFSNQIRVNKFSTTAGTVSSPLGGNINVCNDGEEDMIEATLTGNSGGFQRWIISDANGSIIGLPNGSPFSFEGFPEGTCFLSSLSFENGIGGLTIGSNINGFSGCFALSNMIQINKESASGGSLATTDGNTGVSVCLEDNIPDIVNFEVSGVLSDNTGIIITDNMGNILALPGDVTSFDFAGTGAGICRIYNVGYNDAINGLSTGQNISGLDGCFSLSNFITVFRSVTEGGSITTTGGETNVTICVSDGIADPIDVIVSGANNTGDNRIIITDDLGNILALPTSLPFDFEPTGVGICNIYNVNFAGSLDGLMVGGNIANLAGCFDLSNSIIVNRFDFDSMGSNSTVIYNMDACSALTGTTQFDYDEFVPVISNGAGCTRFSASTIYRRDPMNFPHSCTPGVGGTIAVCVSSQEDCTYQADSDYAIRFDVTVTPGSNGIGAISTLNFYEAAPLNFIWLNGISGPNNFPTQYGVRVLRDGQEIYRQTDIATSPDFTLETFDFSSNPNFTVTSESVFSFELLGYCTAGIVGAPASAWDIDNLSITTNCSGALNGGSVSLTGGGTTTEICADDGEDDFIDVTVTESNGPNLQWIITDDAGNILALPSGPPFNLEGQGPGVCNIYNIAFLNGLEGLTAGGNIDEFQGCYSLSNAVAVSRNTGADCASPLVSGGSITTLNGFTQESHCIDDGIADIIDIELTQNSGLSSAWIITNIQGQIIDVPENFPYDFEGTAPGRVFIYHISFNGEILNMDVGNIISDIRGNVSFSNGVMINKEACVVEEVDEEVMSNYATDITIYPNPTTSMMTIMNNQPSNFGSEVILYNSFGQILGSYSIHNDPIQVDVSEFSTGFYHVKMISGQNEVTKAFSKM